jgi:hypothetical protein
MLPGTAWQPVGQVTSSEVSTTTVLGRVASLQAAPQFAVSALRHEPLLLEEELEELLEDELELELLLLLELEEEPSPPPLLPPPPVLPLLPVLPLEPLALAELLELLEEEPAEEPPDPESLDDPQQRLSVMVPMAWAPTTRPLQKVRRNSVCSIVSPTRLTWPPSVMAPLIPGGQLPDEFELEPDELREEEFEALEEDELDEDDEELLVEHGPDLFSP